MKKEETFCIIDYVTESCKNIKQEVLFMTNEQLLQKEELEQIIKDYQ